jgi:tyrosyl-tRNA synthetase
MPGTEEHLMEQMRVAYVVSTTADSLHIGRWCYAFKTLSNCWAQAIGTCRRSYWMIGDPSGNRMREFIR